MNRKKFLQIVTTATAGATLATPTVKGSSHLSYEELPSRARRAYDLFQNEVKKVSEITGASRAIVDQITTPRHGFAFVSKPRGFTLSFNCRNGQQVQLESQKGDLKARYN